MSDKRDNCIILLIEAPVPENINPELRTAFGAERAAHINLDLLQNTYKLAKNFAGASLILSFEKSHRHPDLTWLDSEDPGFLESKGKNLEGRIADAFRLAFNTGAKKALLLNHLSPKVSPVREQPPTGTGGGGIPPSAKNTPQRRVEPPAFSNGIKAEWLSQAFDSVTEKTITLGLNQDSSVYIVGLTQNNLKVLEGISFSSPKTAEEISEKAKKNKLSVFSLPEAAAIKSEDTLRKWIDARDSDPSLFLKTPAGTVDPAAPPAANPQEEKKHAKRGNKNTSPPPPLPDPEQKLL